MAISRLTGQDANNSSVVSSVSATYASTPTAGNLLIAVVKDNSGSPTITGWSTATGSSSSAANNIVILYKVATGSESTTVTANDALASVMRIFITEYTGFVGTPTIDQVANTSSSISASVATGTTSTTTDANELLIGAGSATSGTGNFVSWSNSFNATYSSNADLFTSERIVAATSTYSSTLTVTNVVGSMAGCIATFKGVSGSKSLGLLGVG